MCSPRFATLRIGPYADEARIYLAKAALKAGDLTSATRELQIAWSAKQVQTEMRRDCWQK